MILNKTNSAWNTQLGLNIRRQRVARGLSQEGLAASLNLSFQQVQKYEKGVNRVSAERLWDISTILNVPVVDFFNGMEVSAQVQADQGMLELAKIYAELSAATQFILRKIASLLRSWEAKQVPEVDSVAP